MAAAEVPVRSVEDIRADHARVSRGMINCDRFSDLTFIVEGRSVFGHKAIVAAHSEYLRAQLSGAFCDSCGPIHVDDIGYDAFVNVILEWIYTGLCCEPADSDAIQILKLAERWQLEDLVALTARQISKLAETSWDLCLQAMNFAFQHCELSTVCTLDDSSPPLWSALFSMCFSHFKEHSVEVFNTSPSVMRHIESYELMHMALSCVDVDALPSSAALQLGHVLMQWLNGSFAPSDCATTHDVLFDVFDHLQSLVGPGSLDAKASLKFLALDIADSARWLDESHSVVVENWTHKIRLAREGDNLACYMSQQVSCDFLNRWPWPTQVELTLEGKGGRGRRCSLKADFTRRFRNDACYWGYPDLLPMDSFSGFVDAGRITLSVTCSVLPSPVARLCLRFACLSFQSIRRHSRLPLVQEPVLRHMLLCGDLDAKSESEVVQVVVAWSRHHRSLSRELLECVILEYVPWEDLKLLDQCSCGTSTFEQVVEDRMGRQSSSRPRASYAAYEIYMTVKNLMRFAFGHQDSPADEAGVPAPAAASRGLCRCGLPSGPVLAAPAVQGAKPGGRVPRPSAPASAGPLFLQMDA